MDIQGKVAIVTGGAEGIGRAIVDMLLGKGATGVGIIDVNAEKGEQTLEDMKHKYGEDKAVFVNCDVRDSTQLKAAFDSTKTRFGRLDIVCNNAGIANEMKPEECVSINFIAVIRGTYLAVEHMGTKNGGNGGVVINTASAAGIVPVPIAPIYSATKHGVVGFTRSVAKEPMVVENGVRVSAICPAYVQTAMTDLEHVEQRSRYGELLSKEIQSYPVMPTTDVARCIIAMIEDSKYDGSACLLLTDSTLTIISPPNIELK